MAIDPYANCNFTVTDESQCTLETCCLAQSNFLYIPSYGANLFFTIFFAVAILPQFVLGILYRTWGFAIALIVGLVLEVLGYAARLQINDNPFDNNAFLLYLIAATIAPVFISAGVYLCLGRIIVVYGQSNSRFTPRTVALAFMTSDFLSLLLQAVGGAIAETANDEGTKQTGVDIMIAGLVLQAISLAVFLLVVADFGLRCRRGVLDMNAEKQKTRERFVFKAFMASLLLATVAILIRSIFRVAELWGGFSGKLWNNETDFLVLDGAMIGLAIVCLTAFHPGVAFGGMWRAASWSFKARERDYVYGLERENNLREEALKISGLDCPRAGGRAGQGQI
ncbi:putative RTA1 domain protein [Teratosphaeria nubilosa]|uniref:Putative RTA1 domain protein n=1 Tax=Teratosphaeria nubilosa TaxID=161662 RepID=A0A6G1L6S6_9PEZI|nr:putative RTA1 domain protein [Teratosphaeria nubilosa]